MTARSFVRVRNLRRDFATNTGWSNPLVNAIFRVAISRGWVSEASLEPR